MQIKVNTELGRYESRIVNISILDALSVKIMQVSFDGADLDQPQVDKRIPAM